MLGFGTQISAAFLHLSCELVIEKASGPLLTIMDYAAEELIGVELCSLFSHEQASSIDLFLRNVGDTDEGGKIFHVRTKHRALRCVGLFRVPAQGPTSTNLHFIQVTMVDLSGFEHDTEASATLASLPAGLMLKEPGGRIRYANKAQKELLWGGEDLIGKNEDSIISEENTQRIVTTERKLLNGEIGRATVRYSEMKEEREFVYESLKTIFCTPLTGESLILSLTRDISDDFRLEQVLQKILAPYPQGVFWKRWNPSRNNLVYEGCNEAFAFQIGFNSIAGVVGKTDEQLFQGYPTEVKYYHDTDMQVLSSGKPNLNIEDPISRQVRSPRIFLTHKLPMIDSKGQVVGIMGFNVDMTGQTEAYERASKDLIHVLMTLSMHLETRILDLKKESDPQKAAAALDSVQKRLSKMKERSIRFLTKAGHFEAPCQILLADVIHDIRTLVEGDKRIKFLIEDEMDAIRLVGNHIHLDDAISELVGNASKIAPTLDNGGEIRVIVRRIAERRCAVYVEDNGIGMDPIPNEAFYIKNKDSDGTGRGLAMVAKYVAALQGTLTQQPRMDQRGAFFTIELPCLPKFEEYG